MTTDEIIAAMLAGVAELAPVSQPLAECGDCLLASPVIASADLPHRSLASRDGFAVRAADVSATSVSLPIRLPVVGEISFGETVSGVLPAGCAFRVMTGAPLPNGADAVVRFEDVQFQHAAACQDHVDILFPAASGQFVAVAGSEFAAGTAVLQAGLTLGPTELAVLSALGLTHALVVPKPRVAIVVTGTELRRQSADSELPKLYASNGVLVTAMLDACGGVVESLRIVSDDPAELADALQSATSADFIVTTGGTGRGSRDVMGNVLRDREVSSMWNLKVRGSRPATFRLLRRPLGDRLIPHLALPGRPVAAMVAFSLFACPLLRRLSARPPRKARYLWARLAAIPQELQKSQRFLPVRLRFRESGWEAVPTGDASLYGLAAAIGAHGFALLGQASDEPAAGQLAQVLIPPWQEMVEDEAS